ncbi:patatin-like phospholipase family protein [Tenacibaculum sp. 190524A05c]|uniref:patatin-like phospholipase family protein n=1 Tax=Tenacibaculum platacis TaxID=3137852 RepID=UPI0031FB3AF6
MTNKKFKLCITMAGAVSAGAYTAGVLDYLLETLHLWEIAKENNRKVGLGNPGYDNSIPMHEVEIDVISGASAGGITGTLAVLNLLDKNYNHYNRENSKGENNRFYKSWVKMADDDKEITLSKMLHRDDIKAGEKPESLLNTKAIESIADEALLIKEQKNYPKYISKNLDLILTISNLRGINFKVDFDGRSHNSSGTTITNHGGFFRYKTVNNSYPDRGIPKENDSLYHVLDLKNQTDISVLRNATLSTSAFPIGLKSRQLNIYTEYLNRYPKYLFGKDRLHAISPILKNEKLYHFNSIDGGLINNEPYGIALKVMHEKNANILKNQDKNYAVIMVDPFPNLNSTEENYTPKSDIISVVKGMFKALRNQVMFNQDGILEALSLSDRTKFLIAPIRKEKIDGKWVRAQNDLASAPLNGFAGFLDESFREHDFKLGRQNCQTFLRYYFAVKDENIQSRLQSDPSKEAEDRFSFSVPPKDPNANKFYPIIPDVRLLNAFKDISDKENYGSDAKIHYPIYPKFDTKRFEKIFKTPIKRRISYVVKGISNSRMLTFGFNRLFKNKAYNYIKNTIEKELEEAQLIKKD